jgi:hypothetical protein
MEPHFQVLETVISTELAPHKPSAQTKILLDNMSKSAEDDKKDGARLWTTLIYSSLESMTLGLSSRNLELK